MELLAIPIALAVALFVLFLGATLLRAGVALANKTIGRVKSEEPIGWDWDAEEDDTDYDAEPDGKLAMQEPSSWLGMRVLFLGGLTYLAVTILSSALLDYAMRRETVVERLIAVVAVLVGFLVMTASLATMLPTTGRRAALAVLYFHLIIIAIVAAVVGILYLILGTR